MVVGLSPLLRLVWIPLSVPLALAVGFGLGEVWKRWARPKWRPWAMRRARDREAVERFAMIHGVIPKDRVFKELAREATLFGRSAEG